MTSCFDEIGSAKDSTLAFYRGPSAQNRLDLLILGHRGRNEDETQHSGGKFTPVHNTQPLFVFRDGFDLFPKDTLLEREPTI